MQIRLFCLFLLLTFAALSVGQQSAAPAAQPDIVRILMPVGVPLRKVPAGNVPKNEAISKLNELKKSASGKRLQEISFLLAVLGSDYEKNRDYLLSLLNNCATRKGICDEDPGAYLVNLYRRGHNELLAPLLDAANTRHAALAELLGSFYSSVITRSPSAFVAAIKTRPQPEQKNLCYMAGAGDGSGMPPEEVNKVRKALRTSSDKVAKDCLAQVEQANKKL